MSGATHTPPPVLKRSISPRPPAVGQEVKKFHDTPHQCLEQYKNYNMECNSKTNRVESADQLAASCTENATESGDCAENSPNPSPPAAIKWAQSLRFLLEDVQGVSLFEKFLKQECQDMGCLSFWFACRGVKKHDPSDRESLLKLINVMFNRQVKRRAEISNEAKEEIRRKLSTNTDIDNTIFDRAQQEIEAYMMKTTYPNFLKSDLYIQHLGGWQNELCAEKDRGITPESVEQLPTVHEDSELYIPKIPLTKISLLQRNKYGSKFKTEAPASSLQSPYNYSSYHAKYSSFLPASARDSELQSLSSDAQTDDTMSATDGSNVDYPTHPRNKHKRSQKVSKQPMNSIYNNKDRLNLANFVPRTERLPEKPLSQEEFHAALVKALNLYIEKSKKDQNEDDKLNNCLKRVEEPSRSEEISSVSLPPSNVSVHQNHKPNAMFDAGFLAAQTEENVQDILDQHISRVFDSGQHTPAPGMLSPTIPRPPNNFLEKSRTPMQGSGELSEYSASNHSQVPQFTVPNSIKCRRDHDTYSTDSAMCDYKSEDNLPIDYSRRYKEFSKRYASKKFSSVTDSSSSFFDSGISCESVPSYSKVAHWLETKDQERELHSWRNSFTSPVLSRSGSSRRTGYNSSRGGSQAVAGYSQCFGAPAQQYPYDAVVQGSYPPPDNTTSNLVEARRKLKDDKAKNQARKPARKSLNVIEAATANNAPSNDVTVIGYCYGYSSTPFLSKMPGKNITLRQFKSVLTKKGNFRYFFKKASNDFGTGVVFEEVTEDAKIVPLWEGKVFCVIESKDEANY